MSAAQADVDSKFDYLLCGDCSGWKKRGVVYPYGGVGLCPVTGKAHARDHRCRITSELRPKMAVRRKPGALKALGITSEMIRAEYEKCANVTHTANRLGISCRTVSKAIKEPRRRVQYND